MRNGHFAIGNVQSDLMGEDRSDTDAHAAKAKRGHPYIVLVLLIMVFWLTRISKLIIDAEDSSGQR